MTTRRRRWWQRWVSLSLLYYAGICFRTSDCICPVNTYNCADSYEFALLLYACCTLHTNCCVTHTDMHALAMIAQRTSANIVHLLRRSTHVRAHLLIVQEFTQRCNVGFTLIAATRARALLRVRCKWSWRLRRCPRQQPIASDCMFWWQERSWLWHHVTRVHAHSFPATSRQSPTARSHH